MVKPNVTITFGRSGQRVVNSSGVSNGGRFKTQPPSGGKRSLEESFASRANHSLNRNSKRMKQVVTASGHGYNRQTADSGIGPNDLRVKLTEKRISRRTQLEIADRKRKELYEKVSRAISSAESLEDSLSKNKNSSTRVDEPRQMDTMRTSYASQTLNESKARSPDRVVRFYSDLPTSRSAVDELTQVSSVGAIDAQRTGRPLNIIPIDSARPSVPLPTTARAPLNSSRLVTELPPATGGMSRPLHTENQPQPLTVTSLLHSLGLGKYVICFQAEEIDMLALRQMGEHDLKDLGIPMGPRKKIISAVEEHTKRLVAQARRNYMH